MIKLPGKKAGLYFDEKIVHRTIPQRNVVES